MTPVCTARAPTMARLFLRLAHRHYSATARSRPAAPLEFLIPRSTLPRTSERSSPKPLSDGATIAFADRCRPHIQTLPSSKRHFTASAGRRATVCVRNPQVDEDGKQMTLEITERAAKRLSEIMTKDSNPNLALRIQVESGGCHGFQYLMSLITLPEGTAQDSSSVVNEDDSIFQFEPDTPDSGQSTTQETARIILDEPSLELLKGSKVDFTMELIGSQFKIVDNPLATSSCGCGTSFDIKM